MFIVLRQKTVKKGMLVSEMQEVDCAILLSNIFRTDNSRHWVLTKELLQYY